MIKKNWVGFVFAFLVPILVVLFWWGAFNRTDIRETRSEPVHYAYTDFFGDLGAIADAQEKVRGMLVAARIQPGSPVVVLYTDPRNTRKTEQHARVGYEIAPGTAVPEPLRLDDIPARNVLRASVQASMQLAPSKAYQALFDYLRPQGRDIRLPTVEIYTAGHSVSQMGTLTVDMAD